MNVLGGVLLGAAMMHFWNLQATRESPQDAAAASAENRNEIIGARECASGEAVLHLRNALHAQRQLCDQLEKEVGTLQERLGAVPFGPADHSPESVALSEARAMLPTEPLEPTDSDFSSFDEEALQEVYPREAIARIRGVFEEAELAEFTRREEDLRERVQFGEEQPGLSEDLRAIWQDARRRLDPDEFAAGLYATGRANRVSLANTPNLRGTGLQPGDVLYSVDGERIFNLADLRRLLSTMDGVPLHGQAVILREGLRDQVPVGVLALISGWSEEAVSPLEYYAGE